MSHSELAGRTGSSHNGAMRMWRESVSSGMRTVEAVIRELSQNDVPVLVVAEPGSGKQAAAARIHALSSRGAEPFHVRHGNEVTGDVLAGWEEEGGTVYLQDVGDLDSPAQAELVRQIASAAEDRWVPRFICGTSRELEAEVKAGNFAKIFTTGSVAYVCGCLRCASAKKIFRCYWTGSSRSRLGILPAPCRFSAPRRRVSFSSITGRETFAN